MRYLFCALLALFCLPSSARAAPIAIERVTIIDPATGTRRSDVTVLVDGAKIIRVARAQRAALPRGAKRIDGSGKYLIPGLWDMHVHLFNNASRPGTDNRSVYFPLLIANGITGVRDMWTDPEDNALARRWRSEMDSGRSFGPRIATGSSIIDGVPATWPNSIAAADEASARAAVRREKAAGAGFIKVYERLGRPTYFAIADEARRVRLPFAGHVPFGITATEASRIGQRSIEHLTDMTASCSAQEAEMRAGPENRARSLLAASAYDAAKCRRLGQLFARNGTAHAPTLVMHSGRLIAPFARTADPRLRFLPGDVQASWRAADTERAKRDSTVLRGMFDTYGRIVADLSRGGAMILAGTDLGNPHVFAGSSLHDELGLLVRAGMSNQAALASATTNPVRYLGLERTLGSIAAGKLADFLLLDADPLADIGNTRRIAGVVSNGRYFDRDELASMQQAAAAAASGSSP